ncbi:MAG: glycosyltransferase family 4 protein [Muribaculaceae bacterium]|nr:glycosyltransferase family 4 protein [Muribaculaceae bacterium]
MNILYLTSGLNMGGTELFTLDLVQEMMSRGETVYWGTASRGGLKGYVDSIGIQTINCRLDRHPFPNPLWAMARIRTVSKTYKIDVIHAVDAYSAIVACLAFKYTKKRPKIVWTNVGIGISTYKSMQRYCSKLLDAVTTETQYVRNRLIEARFEPERIQVFYKCRPMKKPTMTRETVRNKFGFTNADIVIGTVGRVVRSKGNHTIIEAMPRILESCPNVKLLIVGNGPEEENLRSLAVDLGVSDAVRFEGFHNDIENIYPVFDVVAFPTYNECLGHISFEAMFYKKPLVASFTSGNIENVQSGVNGVLVPPGMPRKWADALIRVIEDKEFAASLVNNGVKYVEELDENRSKVNDGIQNLYKVLCQ